ncbi:MAG TPA: glycogen debranching N-terminal domain-containing protein [Candidatus Limnocylindrales bacterium]
MAPTRDDHPKRDARAEGGRRPASSSVRHERRERVLAQGQASVVSSIADAVVIKDADIFLVCRRDGSIPAGIHHGYGLYYRDCRYLDRYDLRLADATGSELASSDAEGFAATIELSNPDIRTSRHELIVKEHVGITWRRLLDGERLALHDALSFENFGRTHASFPFTLTFDARFEDIFDIRGLLDEIPGHRRDPRWDGDALVFTYDGKDRIERTLAIVFSPAPDNRVGTSAVFDLSLDPHERKAFSVTLALSEKRHGTDDQAEQTADQGAESAKKAARSDEGPGDRTGRAHAGGDGREEALPGGGERAERHLADEPPDVARTERRLAAAAREWIESHTRFSSDSLPLDTVVERSLRDLHLLRSDENGDPYYAAGLPWFAALFGRDSIISALQTLAFDPAVAEGTLRVLARLQGTKVDDWRDEQPGKILHELRVGEFAHLGEIPHTPYYGSIDSTPLFLILLARHAAWTGSLDLFRALRDNVERALRWIDEYGDSDGDGFVDYQGASGGGLVNQGWKDSGDSIMNADGSLATPPIALVEVQGYVYAARYEIADLFERDGDPDRAGALRAAADALQARFDDRFWVDELGTYALALEKDGRQCAVVASNPGQALWSGIVPKGRARTVVERLLADDMHDGWGIRTLSSDARDYNPIGYHLGTVWPHDNSLIAAGFRRYGFDDEAQRIVDGIVAAAMDFPVYRLPEVFAGFARRRFDRPVRYPVACHPQAWAAGSVPYLLQSNLGIRADAFNGRLYVERPRMPSFVDHIELQGIRVGRGTVDLAFDRAGAGATVSAARADGVEVVTGTTVGSRGHPAL